MKNSLRNISILVVIALFALSSFVSAQEPDQAVATEATHDIKIGVLMPKVQLTEVSGEVDAETALRNTYAALMNSKYYQLVALESRLTSLALQEAKELGCTYILNLDLSQEVKKSGGGLFGKIIKDAGSRTTYEAMTKVPGGGGTGERIARSSAQSAILDTGYTMSNMAVTVKKNDKFVLLYNLTLAETGSVVHSKTLEEKAEKNNDTVLMRMIEESANDLVAVLKSREP